VSRSQGETTPLTSGRLASGWTRLAPAGRARSWQSLPLDHGLTWLPGNPPTPKVLPSHHHGGATHAKAPLSPLADPTSARGFSFFSAARPCLAASSISPLASMPVNRSGRDNPTMRPWLLNALLLTIGLFSSACSTMTPQQAQLAWHAQRLDALQAPDGWLTLVGLDFLPEGTSTIGHCGSATFSYPNCHEPIVGTFVVSGSAVRYTPSGAEESTSLTADDQGTPSVIRSGSVSFTLVRRNGRLALRVRDNDSPTRTDFPGIDLFPYDPSFVVEATVLPAASDEKVAITNVTGFVEEQPVAARLRFTLLGQPQQFVATAGQGGRLFIVFGDATNGSQTYGGGRFMDVAAPADGRVSLDFNRAFNPPCSFTSFATCPLPPEGNRLGGGVTAGERAPRAEKSP